METQFKPLKGINYKNLLADFNLFLCEWFGERDSATISETMNGCVFSASVWNKFDIYLRLWEYSGTDIPDMTAIIVRASYYDKAPSKIGGRLTSVKEREHFENFLNFLKSYLPLYGYTNIAIEQPPIHRHTVNINDYGFDAEKRIATWLQLGDLVV